jgi:hypothetical protein
MKGKELSFALLQESAKSAQKHEKKGDSGQEAEYRGQKAVVHKAVPPYTSIILHEFQNKGVKKSAIRK